MSSYLSNLLTNTTSRYNSLRRTLLESEADGETEDDTHICRVLRAYYIEKGKPFPQWLPPDPKQTQPTQYVATGRAQPPAGGRGGGLSDLFDGSQQQAPSQEQSLRSRGLDRRGAGGAPNRFQATARGQQQSAVDSYSEQRPLPSQKAGSYQNQINQNRADSNPSPAPSGGGSAQERLKARLWGSGRSTSPAPSTSSSQSSASNPSFSQAGAQVAFDRGNSYSSAQSNRNNSYGSNSGSGRSGGPYVSANAPWAGGDDSSGGGAYDNTGGSYGAPRRPPGNPRAGLPSGPRMR